MMKRILQTFPNKNSDSIILQALDKFCRFDQQKQVPQERLYSECEPKHSVHASESVLKAAELVLAYNSSRMHA